MLFDHYSPEEIEDFLGRISAAPDAATIATEWSMHEHDAQELLGIAASRKKNTKSAVKYLLADDLRFGTHHDIAAWRAKRVACDMLIEIGAGVGMQTIEFAKTCTHVVAVEIDKRKLTYCRENCKAAGISNVEFIEGDAFHVIDKLPKPDVVFLDPSRPAQEDIRDLHVNFSPPIHEFIERYSGLCDALAIELPPHIHEIDIEAEAEYASLGGELRRLTLYLGPLMKAPRSAVALPAGVRIEGTPATVTPGGELHHYLYEIDEAVARAQLVPNLLGRNLSLYSTQKYLLATGRQRVENPFFRNSFEVLGSCPPDDASIIAALEAANAKTVVLRASVDPTQYWKQRAKFEKGLHGTQNVHLFMLPEIAIIAKKITTVVVK